MKLTQKNITNLIDEVVIPFERYVLNDATLYAYIKDNNLINKHNIGVAKLAIMLTNDLVGANKLLKNISKIYKELNISEDDMKKHMSMFFKLHKEWVENHLNPDAFHNELVDRFDEIFITQLEKAKLLEDDDDFLMFESEEIDEAIEGMHYEDHRKITAVEYASYEEILDDDLSSIIELKDELEHTLIMHEKIDGEFLVSFGRELHKLSGVLFSTSEFKDVGYALENFTSELENLDLNSLDTLSEELAFALLSQMNEDLQKWIDSVFIKQDAVDIHYGDASFLANIAQFSIMLEHNSSSNDKSDDDFLF